MILQLRERTFKPFLGIIEQRLSETYQLMICSHWNGISLMNMISELQLWEIGTKENCPAHFIKVLSTLQDYFCSQFKHFPENDTEKLKKIAQYLEEIILMKEALAPFAEYVAEKQKPI